PAVPFSNVTRFSFVGMGGNDTLTVNNPAGGLFAPADGIFYDGGSQTGSPGDSLEILGGAESTATYTFTTTNANGHNGTIALVNGSTTATYTFTGLEPITNTGTTSQAIFNLPSGDGDNQAVLEDNGNLTDGLVQLRTSNGTFETVVFSNPTFDTR